MSARKELRFTVRGRQIVATVKDYSGRLYVERICQVVKRPRAYGEVSRKLWPTPTPNANARAALDYLGASSSGYIDADTFAAALARIGGAA